MITERKFAEQFSGFWSQCLPFMTPQVVTALNQKGAVIRDLHGAPMRLAQNTGDNTDNDLVAEVGFAVFAAACSGGLTVEAVADNDMALGSLVEEASQRIRVLRETKENGSKGPFKNLYDALFIATCLELHFSRSAGGREVMIHPPFRGCGLMNSCFGDILQGTSLYEVKCVDRNLRGSDLRQVLTYCALNYQSHQYEINTVCVLNPRRGMSYKYDLEDLSLSLSGTNTFELLHRIGDFLMNYETLHPSV